MRNDRGGIIVGYFAKIALAISVFALVSFDAVAVGVARVGVEDLARSAAVAGAEAWNSTKSSAEAYRAAVEEAGRSGGTIPEKSFSISPEGIVTVTVEKEATTLLLYRTKKTGKWAHVSATASGRAV